VGDGLDADETSQLVTFCKVVDHAYTRRAFVGGTMKANLEIGFTGPSELYVDTDLGDEDDVQALFVAFRLLVADKEPTQLFKINKLVHRFLTDDELRAYNVKVRARWTQVLHGDGKNWTLHADGKNLRPIDLWKLFANGEVFHRFAEEVAALERLGEISRAIARQQLNLLVFNGVQVACIQRNIVRRLLGASSAPSA
jgi:hypothetical protein